ncbi:MAG: Ku protein [Dethiobacteria bacterium]|jgi:DNA end-binding protein Ku
MWKGSLGFGLVNIPVRLFAATENKSLKFRQLHRPCHSPVEHRKICPICGKGVPWEELARGYEYEKGSFVILGDEEFKAAAGPSDHLIEILDFISIEEIDPVYYQNSYYLAPDGSGRKPYALLRRAMSETGKVAVAAITIRTKETPAVVRVYKDVLALSTMYYPDEVRNTRDLPDIPGEEIISAREMSMARDLIENLAASFDPGKYHDTYREKLLAIIEAKIKGKDIAVAPPAEEEKVVDLLQALEASVEKAREKKGKKLTASRR